ncbi:serine protease 57-like [Podarcis lilfordi]|uniref:Serine protease 57-like n=1 Tax=Podarcis lilfordi TaxID=74358 RepID=A0AA35PSP1_9SAUR|nr:serine protease 57-like [Podarcis lilfordi]
MAKALRAFLLVRMPRFFLVLLQTGLWFFAPSAWGGRVIGGKEVVPHSQPFMASIQVNGAHVCGGFLVRRKWVMTAAHCLMPRRSPSVRIVLGAHSLAAPEASQQIFGVQESIAHPLYNSGTVTNDIRLLKLNGSAVFNHAVQRVRIPRANTDPCPGVMCHVTGWGDTSNFGTIPTILMEANTTIVDRKACNVSWAGQIRRCMICAANTDPSLRGFCSGDSGGPLLCGSRVHGIVSFNGRRCGDRRFPDVYTRISKYIAWIRYVLQTF